MTHRDAAKHRYISVLEDLYIELRKTQPNTSISSILAKTTEIRSHVNDHWQITTDSAFNVQERAWLIESLLWEHYFPSPTPMQYTSFLISPSSSPPTTPPSANPPLFPGIRPLNPTTQPHTQPLITGPMLPKCGKCKVGMELACPMVRLVECERKGESKAKSERHPSFLVRYGTEAFRGPACPRCLEEMEEDRVGGAMGGWTFV